MMIMMIIMKLMIRIYANENINYDKEMMIKIVEML